VQTKSPNADSASVRQHRRVRGGAAEIAAPQRGWRDFRIAHEAANPRSRAAEKLDGEAIVAIA